MKKLFLFFIGISFLMPSCNTHKAVQTVAKSSISSNQLDGKTNEEQRTFLDAIKAYNLGDVPQAIKLLNECVKLNPNNDAALYELSKIYLESQRNEPALLFANQAVKLDAKNKWYQMQYADALASSGKLKDAAAVYETLIKQNPEEEDYYLNGAYLYEKSNQWSDALRLFNQLESKTGSNEELSLQKEQVYLRMGKVDLAAGELEKLISVNPSEVRYYGMLAELYEANNQPEKAMQAYERLMKISPGDGRAYVALAQFYYRKNDYKNFIDNLEKSINSKELDANMKIGLLGLLIQKAALDSSKLPDALHMSTLFTQTNSSDSRAFAIHGDVNTSLHNSEAAMNDYKKSIAIEPKEFAVWQQLFFVLSDLKKNDSLESYSSKAMELFPEQALSYYFNGFANSQLKNFEKSIKNLKRGIPMCADNNALKAQFYASLGDTYHAMKRHNASDSAYEKALDLKPDDAFVMNNYAYYLSCRNMNLNRAEELSKKSNLLQPKNNSFQDTYGWILFQQKKYTDAKEWIEKAYNNGAAQNPTILEHLGDVYFFLNDENKALNFWQQAKQSGNKNSMLDKKIAEKKYFETSDME